MPFYCRMALGQGTDFQKALVFEALSALELDRALDLFRKSVLQNERSSSHLRSETVRKLAASPASTPEPWSSCWKSCRQPRARAKANRTTPHGSASRGRFGQPPEKRWKPVGGTSTRSYRWTIEFDSPPLLATIAILDRLDFEEDRTDDDHEHLRTRRHEGLCRS
jgi:hypothetical protein